MKVVWVCLRVCGSKGTGKLCKDEGVVASFRHVLAISLEFGLTPSKRSRILASVITGIGIYKRSNIFYMYCNTLTCAERATGDWYHS